MNNFISKSGNRLAALFLFLIISTAATFKLGDYIPLTFFSIISAIGIGFIIWRLRSNKSGFNFPFNLKPDYLAIQKDQSQGDDILNQFFLETEQDKNALSLNENIISEINFLINREDDLDDDIYNETKDGRIEVNLLKSWPKEKLSKMRSRVSARLKKDFFSILASR